MTDSRKRSLDGFTGMLPIRLVVPLVLTVFIFIVGLWGYLSIRSAVGVEIRSEAVRDLNLDMTRLQAALEEASRTGNTGWVQDQIAAFGADSHGLVAVLTDESDRVLASAARIHIGRPLDEVLPQVLRDAWAYEASRFDRVRATMTGSVEALQGGSVIVGSYPVLLGAVEGQLRPNRIGMALVARDLTELTAHAFGRTRQKALQIGLGILVLAGASGLLLHLLVTRRLSRIARAADQLATGDLSAKSGVTGNDEIALLGQSFDSMVADLKKHQAALLESNERHRSLFEHAVEGIVTMGEDRLIQSMNPAAQRLFGYTEEEVVGKNVKILKPSPYHEEHDGYVQNYVETGEKKIIGIGREVIGKRKDGSTFPLELSVAELQLTHERVFTGILRDITERKRAEQALAESEERHRSLFQHAVEGIVTMGEDRLIQSMNPAAQKLFGYTEEEVLGKNVKMLMPSPYHKEHDGYVKNYVKTGKKKIIGIGREVIGERKDGYTFPLELSVVDLRLSNSRVFTGILRDITDRKRAEDELQRVNDHLEELVRERAQALEDAQETLVRKERLATLGQLAGSVAHEVRNPLGIVRNAAYYVEQVTESTDEDVRQSFEEIRRGLTRADRIIGELLDYARDPQSHHQEFRVADVINDSLSGIEIGPNQRVDIPVPPPTPVCYGDADQISRILKNLIMNGLQAMPEGGQVVLRCLDSSNADQVTIEVQDTGTGMTEEQVIKVFEPLFTTKTRGIGLGLALSKRYAELNNATLTVESEQGQGSTFRLTLPIHTAP